MRRTARVVGFAVADVLHERWMGLVLVVSVASIVGPLLLLAGLRDGVVSHLREALLRDPTNRELVLVGQGAFDAAWFKSMAARPDVDFVAPRTRFLTTTIRMRAPGRAQVPPALAELWPSGPGEPLAAPALAARVLGGDVALSASLAEALEVGAGDAVELALRRTGPTGAREGHRETLRVVGVLAIEATPRQVAFVDPALMVSVQTYLEGAAPFALSPLAPDLTAPAFRLYAATLPDVERLRQTLTNPDWRLETRASDIRAFLRLEAALDVLFAVTLALMALGGFASVGMSVSANALRKSRELSVLRMLGYDAASLAAFPVAQAVAVGAAGAALGVAIYAGLSAPVAALLGEHVELDRDAVSASPTIAAIALGATVFAAALAATGAMRRLLRSDPAMGLRDG